MTLRIRDVIDIPPVKPPLVVKVGEINDEERKAFHGVEGAHVTGTSQVPVTLVRCNNLPFVA